MLERTVQEQRFWAKVDKSGSGGCWTWTGCVNWMGYGLLSPAHGTRVAHRYAYTCLVGPIPAGLQLDHLCRNRGCVNPSHLEPVTAQENILRGEGICAHNARKTHCPQGHPYSEENTYRKPDGRRVCRTCKNEQQQERRRRTNA